MSEVVTAETGAIVVPEIEAEVKTEVQQEGEENQESTTENDADKPKRKDSVQKRINELTAEKWAEKREKEDLRRELEAIKQQVYQPQQATQAPTLEAYGWDTEAYQQAVYRYAQAEAIKQNQAYFDDQRQQEAQSREQRQFQALIHEHGVREQKFAKSTPDYHEAVEYLTNSIKFNREIVEVIGESERSPEILYHLATNFEEAANLADMPPHKAAAHIARLEARLGSKPKPVSSAPPPAPTLKGSADVKKTVETMTTAERIKYWNDQERKK